MIDFALCIVLVLAAVVIFALMVLFLIARYDPYGGLIVPQREDEPPPTKWKRKK